MVAMLLNMVVPQKTGVRPGIWQQVLLSPVIPSSVCCHAEKSIFIACLVVMFAIEVGS
jgi:hypothetical protein